MSCLQLKLRVLYFKHTSLTYLYSFVKIIIEPICTLLRDYMLL